ncbi:MAG: hypothetical protein R3C71_14375 [Candidatus Krumholzibacteriia bacterium]|nr:hypothetical protein [bacterium]MCB9513403.1 hypothetical protein [Candidatus Latescibacterota bacterium]MCB9516117.1 hypothetical protein [Candidatus Latescibacterota bacterium]
MRRLGFILIALSALTAALPALADGELGREEVRERIRSVKSWELVRDLGLDERTAQSFVPVFEDYDRVRGKLKHQRRGLERTLEELVKDSTGNAPRIRSVMLDMRGIDERLQQNETDFRGRAFPLLSVEQQARFELFEKRWSTRLKELIKEIRQEREQNAPPAPGPDAKARSRGRG